MGVFHDRELADTRQAAAARRARAAAELSRARSSEPSRFDRVRAACVGGDRVELDAHAARIVNTLNRLEAPQ